LDSVRRRAGLKYKHYQSIEAGRKTDIRFSTLEKLAKACGLELYELLNFDSGSAALAEDRTATGTQTTSGKAARKPSQRRTSGKQT